MVVYFSQSVKRTNLDNNYDCRLFCFCVLQEFIKLVLANTSYSMYNKDKGKKSDFDDMCFEQADTFDSLKAVAEMQNDTEIALGWGK